MTKPVTGLTQWGAVTSGSTGDLDTNFSALQDAINDLNTYKNYLTDAGSAGAMTVTLPANITGALSDGLLIQVKVANANPGATTLNYNGTGAANVINLDGSPLTQNQIVANSIVAMQYSNAQTAWQLQTPSRPTSQGWVLISTQSANSSNTVNFDNMISSTYDQYRLTVSGAVPSGNNATMAMRVGTGNTPTYQNANYQFSGVVTFDNSSSAITVSSTGNSTTDRLLLTRDSSAAVYNGANGRFGGEIIIATSADANRGITVNAQTAYLSAVNFAFGAFTVGGVWNNANAVTSVQVLPSNGNITTGNFSLYGLVKS